MGGTLSLIPELEDIVVHGSRARRRDILQRITTLFLDGASRFDEGQVDLFGDVFSLLITEIESKARAELSQQLAPLSNAPAKILRQLAGDDDIAVAAPVLRLSPGLSDTDLIDVAGHKGQDHLRAISARRLLDEAVTDVLVRRGDRDVVRSVAGNPGARISPAAFSDLAERAASDGVLAETVGARPDIPLSTFRKLLEQATAVVHRRLLAVASPQMRSAIGAVLAKVSEDVGARIGPRDYRAAQRVVLSLGQAGGLNQDALVAFCRDDKREEVVVGLAALAKVRIEIADRSMEGDRLDPVLILCKAANLSWSAVKAVIQLRSAGIGIAAADLDAANLNYGRLSASTAQRVVRFWQVRQS